MSKVAYFVPSGRQLSPLHGRRQYCGQAQIMRATPVKRWPSGASLEVLAPETPSLTVNRVQGTNYDIAGRIISPPCGFLRSSRSPARNVPLSPHSCALLVFHIETDVEKHSQFSTGHRSFHRLRSRLCHRQRMVGLSPIVPEQSLTLKAQ